MSRWTEPLRALEALAAAGVFSDAEPECGDQYEDEPRMADKLDAAGIR